MFQRVSWQKFILDNYNTKLVYSINEKIDSIYVCEFPRSRHKRTFGKCVAKLAFFCGTGNLVVRRETQFTKLVTFWGFTSSFFFLFRNKLEKPFTSFVFAKLSRGWYIENPHAVVAFFF